MKLSRLVPVLLLAGLSCQLNDSAAPVAGPSLRNAKHDSTDPCRHDRDDKGGEIVFLCSIAIPSPLTGSQKGWAEQSNAMYFLSDAAASGVQVIDISTHTYVGLIGGMAGAATTGGGTATTNGPGPNSFVSVPRRGDRSSDHGPGPSRVLFVSDGNSTVHVINIESLEIIASVSTAVQAGAGIPANQVCDDGTQHYCGRANEIAYDPEHHVVIVQNPSPLALAAPHGALSGHATFISARYPYPVLGYIFPGPGTLEGQVWVPQLNRFLLPVQNNPTTPGVQNILVVNTETRQIEATRQYTCAAIPGAGANGNNNLQLAPDDNLWAQMCGRPIRMSALTGAIKNVVTQLGTGDQDWYNPGDGNFYNTGAFPPAVAPNPAGPAHLGVMDALTGEFLQAVSNPGGASPSVYAHTNEIYTRVPFTTANDAGSRCTNKGTGNGCVVVFAHAQKTKGGN
jgi:hypothetical protein